MAYFNRASRHFLINSKVGFHVATENNFLFPESTAAEQISESLQKTPSTQSTASNGSHGWRMSVPNYISTIMPQAGQRRFQNWIL